MGRERRPRGFFRKLSCKQLLDYAFNLHGRNIGPFELIKRDKGLYRELLKRKLNNKLKGKIRPRGFFSEMNDRKLLEYTFDEHGKEISPGELYRKDGSLYNTLARRKLNKKLERERIPCRSFKNMSNRAILNYTFKLYGRNLRLNKLLKEDTGLYKALLKRKLTYKFNSHYRPKGFLSNKNDEELLDYVFKLYKNISPAELFKKDRSLYNELRKKKLTERLNRVIKPRGYYKNFENVKRELWRAIEENNGEFPSQKILINEGYSGLLDAVYRDHGGIYSVAERTGYNEIKRQELARELEEIVREL